MKKLRVLMVTLCVAVFLCGFSVTAYAGGGPEWEGLDPAEETTTPEPTIEPGEGFTEEGNLVTRDLLYDEHTNKQFITVQTSGGNTFYIVIDYDKPVDEEGEQYETYFLNVVDEADLLAAAEAALGILQNLVTEVVAVIALLQKARGRAGIHEDVLAGGIQPLDLRGQGGDGRGVDHILRIDEDARVLRRHGADQGLALLVGENVHPHAFQQDGRSNLNLVRTKKFDEAAVRFVVQQALIHTAGRNIHRPRAVDDHF